MIAQDSAGFRQDARGGIASGSRTDRNKASLLLLRACDFFDLFVFSASNQLYFKSPNKAVILSEALRRSIANRGLYGAEPKNPGDACWQMLLGAFRPQTAMEDKSVTRTTESRSQEIIHSLRSAAMERPSICHFPGARTPICQLYSVAIDTAIRMVVLPVEPEVF
jgi:hypothetical protein